VFTECLLNVHRIFAKYLLGVHWMLTECSLSAHWMFTECSLSVLWIFPEYSLVMLSLVLDTPVTSLYFASTLVLSSSTSCSWDEGQQVFASTQPECSLNVHLCTYAAGWGVGGNRVLVPSSGGARSRGPRVFACYGWCRSGQSHTHTHTCARTL
jgi:hypothetical protein